MYPAQLRLMFQEACKRFDVYLELEQQLKEEIDYYKRQALIRDSQQAKILWKAALENFRKHGGVINL